MLKGFRGIGTKAGNAEAVQKKQLIKRYSHKETLIKIENINY